MKGVLTMPKMKSVSGAKKRFKVKKNGQIKRGSAFRSHILTKMSQKRKRNLRSQQTVDATNAAAVKRMLCQL
jgi:large subunit ribosomal protein L35